MLLPLDRRAFLRGAGAAFLAATAPPAAEALERLDLMFATAYQSLDGAYGVALLDPDGKMLRSIDLPDRGHDVTFDRVSGRAVAFARQPGTFALVFDRGGAAPPKTIASVEGRHFYGHGVFSPDGRLLYATENDYEAARGMVGVYDTTDAFRRVGEFSTHGVGPHDMLLCGDGRTLVVANGGIETHPDFGRAELNLTTMKPSLVFLDRLTGDLLERHELPPGLHQLSIRHMDVDAAGTVWFGCQHRGPDSERPSLVGRARRGERFELIPLPPEPLSRLRNYVGSVAANRDAGTVALSSPHGNALLVLDAADGSVVVSRTLEEVCGIAPEAGGFLASTGTGRLVTPEGVDLIRADCAWDNHMLRIDP